MKPAETQCDPSSWMAWSSCTGVTLLSNSPPHQDDHGVEPLAHRFVDLLAAPEPPHAKLLLDTRLQALELLGLETMRPNLSAINAH
jgi:hypothetical protein